MSQVGVPAHTATTDQLVDALYEVIDPDLGVNIVDLGFVNSARTDEHGTALLELTLTSPACPLSTIMEDQIHTSLTGTGLVRDVHITWVWNPPWTPARITDEGREQLRAIGFSL